MINFLSNNHFWRKLPEGGTAFILILHWLDLKMILLRPFHYFDEKLRIDVCYRVRLSDASKYGEHNR